jgi:hypothetical protein
LVPHEESVKKGHKKRAERASPRKRKGYNKDDPGDEENSHSDEESGSEEENEHDGTGKQEDQGTNNNDAADYEGDEPFL